MENLQSRILSFALDNTSGATELLQSAGELVIAAEKEGRGRETALELARHQPSIIPVLNLARVAENAARGELASDVESYLLAAGRWGRQAATELADIMPDSGVIFTLSRSSLVLRGLKKARRAGKELQVNLTEARPAREGAVLARELSEAGFAVRFSFDFGFVPLLAEAQLFVVGADGVGDDYFVNKSGTRAVATMAQQMGVDVVVAATPDKRLGSEVDGRFRIEERDPVEVLDAVIPGVYVVNRYFEKIPNTLVNRFAGHSE